jgi:replicative DNA helicase
MEPQAIAAKTLARMTWDGVPNPAPGTLPQNMRMPNPAPWTPTEIMYMNSKGEASDRLLDDARTRHERWSRNVTIIPHEAAGTPTQIVDTLAAYTRIMGRPACVVIDYLQRLTPDRPADDTKKFLDSACRALALAAHGQDTKTVIVLIASLNREANKAAKITLESFSGSAGIGYEADCALGLREVADNGEAPRDDDALATLAARPLRRYKLQVLKARRGEAGAADLYLYGRAGRFVDARADAIEEIDWKRA